MNHSLNTIQPMEAARPEPRRSARLARLDQRSTSTESPVISDKKKRQLSKSKARSIEIKSDQELTEEPSKPVYKLSSMQFPSPDAKEFGLAQEKLADDPLKVLIACVFLTRTKGTVSMPVCRELFRRYSTAEAIANAKLADIVTMFQPLGLQNRRAKTVIELASAWHQHPPEHGRRYRKLHYPTKLDGLDISKSEQPIEDETTDARVAWEIGHIPGVGAYALDSWRIFCRDTLRGIPHGIKDTSTPGGVALEKAQEWTRVVPLDKELIAYIRWRWLRLNYLWNPVDGSKVKVDTGIISKMHSRELLSYKDFDNPWSVYTSTG